MSQSGLEPDDRDVHLSELCSVPFPNTEEINSIRVVISNGDNLYGPLWWSFTWLHLHHCRVEEPELVEPQFVASLAPCGLVRGRKRKEKISFKLLQ